MLFLVVAAAYDASFAPFVFGWHAIIYFCVPSKAAALSLKLLFAGFSPRIPGYP
jgi:hypothetical protein